MVHRAVASTSPAVTASASGTTARTLLLISGVVSSLLYAAMLVFIPMTWPGYSSASQTVSELSAIGAPTRGLWVAGGAIWTALYVAFGWGVWLCARGNRSLRAVGGAIVASGILGLFWPPMHLRGAETSLTDRLHILWTVATLLLMVLAMGFGAAALGRRFRLYSIATVVILFVTGGLTGLDAPRVAANLPTPWIGVWERINQAAWLMWIVVLAVALLRRRLHVVPSRSGSGPAIVFPTATAAGGPP